MNDFVPDTAKYGTYADFYGTPSGGLGERKRKACARGHPVAQVGHAKCPRCGVYVRVYYCEDRHCDGVVTSRAHETVCPPSPS